MEQQFFIENVKYRFYLRSTQVDKPKPLYCKISVCGMCYKVSLRVKCKPSQWHTKLQKAYISCYLCEIDNHNNYIVNIKITEMAKKIDAIKTDIANNPSKYADVTDAFTALHNLTNGKSDIVSDDWLKAFKRYAVNNNSMYLTAYGHLCDFIVKNKQYADIKQLATTKGIRAFLNYEYERKKNNGEPLSRTSIQKNIDCIRRMIKEVILIEKEIITKTQFNDILFPQLENDTDTYGNEIALDDKELLSFINYVPQGEKDAFARDVFLLCCGLGIRISDVAKVSTHIEQVTAKVKALNMFQQKTNGRVYAPILFPFVDDVFNRHSMADFNILKKKRERDKIVGQIQEIAKNVVKQETVKIAEHRGRNTKITEKEIPRWQKVGTHTGRRTFCTILYLRGWDYEEIAEHTGHSTEQVKQYVKVSKNDRIKYAEYTADELVPMYNFDYENPQPQQQIAPITIPQPQVKGVQTTLINSLNEGQKVLAMLGVEDVQDIDNIDDVLTLICVREHELKQMYGNKLLRGNIKQVFNTYATTKERKQALAELIAEIQKDD